MKFENRIFIPENLLEFRPFMCKNRFHKMEVPTLSVNHCSSSLNIKEHQGPILETLMEGSAYHYQSPPAADRPLALLRGNFPTAPIAPTTHQQGQ